MASPSTARTQGRDRQILQAAAELFFERGYHGVGVVEIGRRIGISGPAIYRHFESKGEILAQLFHEAMDEVAGPIEAHDDPHTELELLVRRHVDLALNQPELLSIFTHEERFLPEPLRKRFRKRMREHARQWEDVLRRAYPEAEDQQITIAPQATIGMIHSAALWPRSALRAPGARDTVIGLALQGLDALERTPESRGSR
jgi:AcrR family transcriptional regulator